MSKATSSSVQSVLDNLHSSVLVVDQNLCLLAMNPSAEMMFQISDARATGRSIKELICHENAFYQQLENSLLSGHPYTVYEASLKTPSGQSLQVDYMISPVEYQGAQKSILLEFVSKGRHRKIAQEENLLQQQDASRSLLRGLAHEIKNPLGGLRGAAQLLEKELDEADKEYTRIIIREADRLQNLVDRMLGPRDLPQKSYINIHQVIEHVRQLVQAETDSVVFETDYDPSLPDLFADGSMLIQAILNITRNAVAAINNDGLIIIKTRTQRNQNIGQNTYPLVTKIDIIDNGEGIPDDIREKIFLPMITGRAEGTGLGLSIAQSVINQHGGLIEFSSQPGETIFSLLIPLEYTNE